MLTLMSIEHELLRSLDFTDTVKEFALANVNAEKNEKRPFLGCSIRPNLVLIRP